MTIISHSDAGVSYDAGARRRAAEKAGTSGLAICVCVCRLSGGVGAGISDSLKLRASASKRRGATGTAAGSKICRRNGITSYAGCRVSSRAVCCFGGFFASVLASTDSSRSLSTAIGVSRTAFRLSRLLPAGSRRRFTPDSSSGVSRLGCMAGYPRLTFWSGLIRPVADFKLFKPSKRLKRPISGRLAALSASSRRFSMKNGHCRLEQNDKKRIKGCTPFRKKIFHKNNSLDFPRNHTTRDNNNKTHA